MGEELAAIVEAGQAVAIGEAEILLVHHLQLGARIDCVGEVAGLHDDDHQQGGRHEQHVDRHGDEGRRGRHAEMQDERHVDDRCDDECRGSQMQQADDDAHPGYRHEEGDIAVQLFIAVIGERQRPHGDGEGHDGGELVGANQRLARHLVRRNYASGPPPSGKPDQANGRESHRNIDRDPYRRRLHEDDGQRPGIHQQYGIHQRDLAREDRELGFEEFRIVLRHRQQLHEPIE